MLCINKTMKIENTHFTFEQLADYVDGRLPTAEIARLEIHLDGCSTCQEELRWLQETTAVMAEPWEAPAKAVRANVIRAFRYYVPANGREENAPQPHKQPVPWLQKLFKARWRFVTAFVAVLLLLFASGQFYQSWAQDVVQNSAQVVELIGTAELQRAGSETWQSLANGSLISTGDRVRTGEGSSVGLQFFENNVTYLQSETQIEIIAFSARRDGQERVITLKQYNGQTYSSGWPPGDQITYLSIKTPDADVAVQALGYDLFIDTAGDDTEISVVKGCAEIVSYDAAAQTSYRQQTGSACSSPPPAQQEPVAPAYYYEL